MENKAYLADNQDIGGDDHHEDDLPTYEQCMRKFNFFSRHFFVRIELQEDAFNFSLKNLVILLTVALLFESMPELFSVSLLTYPF